MDYGVSVAQIRKMLRLHGFDCFAFDFGSVSLGYEAGPLVQRGLSWERQTLAKGGEMTKAEISLACGCDAEKGAIGGTGTRRGGGRI